MPTISVNGKSHQVPNGITIIQACEIIGIEIPRFCYHERLAIAGNCRMCLVEVAGGPPKPVASCAMPVAENMQIFTDTPMVKKAREGVMEFLLANHPLDCPICDQGGECDLQDQAYQYGKGKGQYQEHKRAVKDKNMGPLIKTQMTRCIHCTRCVRFIEDVAGTCEIGASGRGENMEITSYLEQNIKSELSGNIIDLCPVGALTSKPYAFKARSWELKKTETIDIMDAVGSNIRIDSRGLEIMRILPRLNEEINEEWISDKTRFCYDGLKYQRLDKPYLKKNDKLEPTTFDKAYSEIIKKINELKPTEIAFLTGKISAVEEIYALKTLAKKLGIENIDCRIAEEKFSGKIRGEYFFNTTISGIENADACLMIGVNPRKDAPIINARLRKRYLSKKFKIATIGDNLDLTYKHKNLGNDISLLKEILNGSHEFCEVLRNAKNPMLIVGQNIVERDDGLAVLEISKAIANEFNMIREDWNGFNFLANNTGLINGLEVNFFGNSGVSDIINKAKSDEIKMIILHSVDDCIEFEKLQNCFVVYIGSHGDEGAKIANVILPACAYSEKEAIYVNVEGRPQMTKKAVFAPGNSKPDWEIIVDMAKKLNIDLGFSSLQELRKSLINEFPIFKNLDSPNKASISDLKSSNKDLNKIISEQNISIKNYDFYLTNSIARASRILNKCSSEIA